MTVVVMTLIARKHAVLLATAIVTHVRRCCKRWLKSRELTSLAYQYMIGTTAFHEQCEISYNSAMK